MILLEKEGEKAMFLIRVDFNAGPDLAFYLNADPDPNPDLGSQTNPNHCGSVFGSW
jgi:hypothetical protein